MDITFIASIIAYVFSFGVLKVIGEQFKLSSLPHLKKWEIPSMPHKYSMRTGRKFKDFDKIFATGRKRSSHWSIQPELNFRELEFEEDAEKIKLDQNYKAFLEDDDTPQQFGIGDKGGLRPQQNGIIEENDGKRSWAAEASRPKAIRILPSKRHGISEKPIKKKHRVKKRRKDASKDLRPFLNRGPMLNSSEGVRPSTFSTADIRSHFSSMVAKDTLSQTSTVSNQPPTMAKQNSLSGSQEKVSKRSVENEMSSNLMNQRRNQIGIGDAIKRARVAINNLENRKPTVNKPVVRQNLMKLVSVKGSRTPRASMVSNAPRSKVQQSNLQESRNQALKLLKNSGLNNKSLMKSGVLGDQPSKDIGNRMNEAPAKSAAGSQSYNSVKASKPVNGNKKPSQPTQAAQLSARTKIETPRGEIEKPKEKMKIVPANVARAVAMAMEQLKRDRMWGKVFVHVLPSGKLKVMVQETKKMPEE